MNEPSDQRPQPQKADEAQRSDRSKTENGSKHSGQSGTHNRSDKQQGRGRRGSRGKAHYSFADGLEHCFCRNATRVPPKTFPVAGRNNVATPALVELARTEHVILLCDLLHEGPHMWPSGDEFNAEEPAPAG